MAEPQSQDGTAPPELPRAYDVVLAVHRDKRYRGCVLLLDPVKKEMELRQLVTKRRKKVETVIARFRVEPTAEVKLEGAVLHASELSITLESEGSAQEVADLLKRPVPDDGRAKALHDAEASVVGFLKEREEVLGFLSQMRVDPRKAVIERRSMWAEEDAREPFEAIRSSYAKELTSSLETLKAGLTAAEKTLGIKVSGRLCALACTIAAAQDALLDERSDLVPELAALQELGIAMTAADLRLGEPTERLMLRAHTGLEALALSGRPA